MNQMNVNNVNDIDNVNNNIDAAAAIDTNEKKLVESKELPGCCVIGLCVYNNEPGLPSVLSNIVKIIESGLFEKITVVSFLKVDLEKKSCHKFEIPLYFAFFTCEIIVLIFFPEYTSK